MEDMVKIVKRYKDADSWYTSTVINEDDFNHIQEIMESAGELEANVPYSSLVDTSFAKKVSHE